MIARSRSEVLSEHNPPANFPANRSSQETNESLADDNRRQGDVSPPEPSDPVLNDKWLVEQLNREKEELLHKVRRRLSF